MSLPLRSRRLHGPGLPRSLRRMAATLGSVAVLALASCGAETGGTAEAEEVPAATDSSAAESGSQPADVPPTLQFSGTTIDGSAFDGASLAGKPAVLWFWAPWCPTCRGQIDGVSDLAESYGDDVGFVGVGSLDDATAIEGFADDVPAEEIVQLSDPDGEIWRHFEITAQSTFVVLDRKGEVQASGYVSEGEVARLVADLAG